MFFPINVFLFIGFYLRHAAEESRLSCVGTQYISKLEIKYSYELNLDFRAFLVIIISTDNLMSKPIKIELRIIRRSIT